jgi:hypothetical protein
MGNWRKVSLTAATAVNRKICHERSASLPAAWSALSKSPAACADPEARKMILEFRAFVRPFSPLRIAPSNRCWNLS